MLMNNSLERTSSFLTASPWTLMSPAAPKRLEMPARRTAALMALTADWILVSNCERLPTAVGYFLCSAKTNRVKVMQLVSMG